MTLYEFLRLEKSDFDTYDTVFDIEVTVCCPMEFFVNGTGKYADDKWYDAFYDFILKHVELVEKTGECSCTAEWTKFITDNLDVFKEAAIDLWEITEEQTHDEDAPDSYDDLIYEWIDEISKWMAGYANEAIYKDFMEKYAPRLKEV